MSPDYHAWTHRPKHLGGTDPIESYALWPVKVFRDDEPLVVTTGDTAFVFEVPEDLDGHELLKVEGFISNDGSSATVVQIYNRTTAALMLSTALQIDAFELNSKDSSAPHVIDQDESLVTWGDHLEIRITSAGSSATGLGVYLYFLAGVDAVSAVQGPQGEVGPEGPQGDTGPQGPQGDPGGVVAWQGEWDSGTTYSPDDAVSHNGSSYVAITGSTNVEPGTAGSEEEWMLLAEAASLAAEDVTVADSGGYFAGTDVEAVLQDLGLTRSDGWTPLPALTYASATTFTASGDLTTTLTKGTRIKLTQTTVKYFVVASSSHSGGTTTVTITGGTDYTLANAAISSPFYSYVANPQGWPGWFICACSPTGFSSVAVDTARFNVIDRVCHFDFAFSGTSNATTFTITLPIAPASMASDPQIILVRVTDSGAATFTGCFRPGSASAAFGKALNAAGGFTASGTKGAFGVCFYGI